MSAATHPISALSAIVVAWTADFAANGSGNMDSRKSVIQLLDTPIVVVAITAVCYAIFLSIYIGKQDYDLTAFIDAGDFFTDPDAVVVPIHVRENTTGYDGQFYFRLALSPFTTEVTELGVRLDNPPYRQQRILYPLLVNALAMRNATAVPVALLLVNYLALCAIGWLGALIAQGADRHAFWGTAFPFYAGFIITLARDLAEIVAMACLLAFFLLMQRKQFFLAAGTLILAVFAKETSLIVVAAILIVNVWRKTQKESLLPWHLVVGPLTVFAGWQGWLYWNWGEMYKGNNAFETNIGMPFVGIIDFLNNITAVNGHFQTVWLNEFILMALFTLIILGVIVWHWRELLVSVTAVAFIGYLALALLLTHNVWVEDWAFMRALSELYLLGILILFQARSKMIIPVTLAALVSWFYLYRDFLYFR